MYRTVCASGCEHGIEPDDEIRAARDGEGWEHVKCPGEDDGVDTGPLCSKCFTYHRGECA